jgi:hypothetical protein
MIVDECRLGFVERNAAHLGSFFFFLPLVASIGDVPI